MSLFRFQTRIPKHQRFHIDPRFYDPVKEDIRNREFEIKREIEQKKSLDGLTGSFIEDSFGRRAKQNRKTTTLQVVLMLGLLALAVYILYF